MLGQPTLRRKHRQQQHAERKHPRVNAQHRDDRVERQRDALHEILIADRPDDRHQRRKIIHRGILSVHIAILTMRVAQALGEGSADHPGE